MSSLNSDLVFVWHLNLYFFDEIGSHDVDSGFWAMRCQKVHGTQAFKAGFSKSKYLLFTDYFLHMISKMNDPFRILVFYREEAF